MYYSSVHSTVSAVVSASLQPEDDATESTLTHAQASADARPSTSAAVQTIGNLGYLYNLWLIIYFLRRSIVIVGLTSIQVPHSNAPIANCRRLKALNTINVKMN